MSRSHGCERATLCADNPARRRKHIHVGLTKTSMFWILAGSSALGFCLFDLALFMPAQKTYKTNVENVTDVFHVYSIDWTKDMIKFYIDGVSYYNVGNDGRGVDAYPFMAPEFLLLNVAVGGNFAGNTIDDTIFPCRMVVDYVRVYQ